MKRFAWFNDSAPDGKKALPALTGVLAHLCLLCTHPFEDGNASARALAEKALAQNLGQPTLAYTIART